MAKHERADATLPTAPMSNEQVRGAPLAAQIRVREPASPVSFRLASGSCTVGSHRECDIVISDSTVSRNHARLTLVPEGVAVSDLGSRNGTFYLEQRIESAVLSLGSSLRVGKAILSIDVDEELYLQRPDYQKTEYRGAIGASAAMRRVFGLLERLESSLATVLLEGESGVGKEIVARAIRQGSPVAAGPYVAVNCGALPRELAQSELFGHRRGAFTGASENRRGAFESADGGTIFLDEVGELPVELQPLLLRVLETGEVRPLGADEARRLKVRVLAATNRDLKTEVHAGRFREDLYYRLAVVRLKIPPLRDRVEDIEPLALRFAEEAGLYELPRPVLEQVKSMPWRGNVRELRNVVHAYAALGMLPEREPSCWSELERALADVVDVEQPYAEQKERILERFTRVYLSALLARSGGNLSAAARLAGLDRSYFGKLVSKHAQRDES